MAVVVATAAMAVVFEAEAAYMVGPAGMAVQTVVVVNVLGRSLG
jgi:hypothetical protein